MAESGDSLNVSKPLARTIPKSELSDEFVYIKFTNRTRRLVDIFWHDFDGNLVRYLAVVPPTVVDLEEDYRRYVDTFVTHPWSAKDSLTGQTLKINGNTVYYPANEFVADEERIEVCIDLPVYTLQDMCMHLVRQFHGVDGLDTEIPRILIQEMSLGRSVEYSDYIPPGDQEEQQEEQ